MTINLLAYILVHILKIIVKFYFLVALQVSAWGGYVFIINLIPLHVFVLLLMQRFSSRVYIGELQHAHTFIYTDKCFIKDVNRCLGSSQIFVLVIQSNADKHTLMWGAYTE